MFSFVFSIVIWISISLSNDYYQFYEIPLVIENLPEGYSVGSDIPSQVRVEVKATGWKLLGLSLSKDLDYKVNMAKDTGKVSVSLQKAVSDNQWVSSNISILGITPSNIYTHIVEVDSKQVPVVPVLEVSYAEGYGLAAPIRVEPDSVEITGAPKMLAKVDKILTDRIELNDILESTTVTVGVENLRWRKIQPGNVTVHFDVQKIVEKKFDNIEIEIKDLPPDRNVVLLPPAVSVTLRGGLKVLGKIKAEEIKAVTYYNTILADTLGFIKPEISIPERTQLISSTPDRIRYIIKKF